MTRQNFQTGDLEGPPQKTYRVGIPVVQYYYFDVAAEDEDHAKELATWHYKHGTCADISGRGHLCDDDWSVEVLP